MSITSIVSVMDKLSSLHESLLALSKEKTDMLKEGDSKALQTLLVKERKHIQAITQIENERSALVADWFHQQGLKEEPTISAMLEHLSEHEQAPLTDAYERLVSALTALKQQEELNKELTHQSLQFIELSLDMLQPSMKNMNYSSPGAAQQEGASRSVFDSKA
ncbi:flagellar protein FlgN [Pontibacillus salicampi]|uniref:Flagellar protein FlgN n=1 Tax=Pontibacillus salicampi TaxID=1449801 RepID=A0ABV6LSU1_9BACI